MNMTDLDIESEYQKLNKEIMNLISEYDNMIYEDKIYDKKYLILNDIINKLEEIGSPLKTYFITEKKIYGGIDIINYFYSEDYIKKIIDQSHIDWIIFREKLVKTNYLLRAKYCWIIWCLGNRNYLYLEKCARYCLYTLLIYYSNNWNEFYARNLIEECIGKVFNCYNILKRKKAIERLIKFSLELCKKLDLHQDSFVVHNIIQICSNFLKHYDSSYTKKFIAILESDYQIQRKKIPITTAENSLDLMIKLQSDETKKKNLRKRKAEFYIEIAKMREPPVKYHFYDRAARIYQEIGEPQLKKICLKKMEEIHLENYMIPIGITIDLTKIINEYKKIARDIEDKHFHLDILIEYILFPSYKQLQKIPKDIKSIKDLFPTVIVSGGTIIDKLKTKIDKEKERVYQYYLLENQGCHCRYSFNSYFSGGVYFYAETVV